MSNAYAVTNLVNGLAASAFVFSVGAADATRARLNDVRMDKRYVNGSPTTSLSFTIDLGSAIQTSGIALLNHNFGTAALAPTVRIRSGTAAAAGVVTTGAAVAKAATTLRTDAPYQKDHVFQYTAVTRQFLEVLISFTGTATSLAIGEVFVFNSQTVMSRLSDYGGGESEEIKSAVMEFDGGGSRSSFLGGPIRAQRLPYSDLNATERAEQATLWRSVRGPVTPFIWIDSYEATALAAAASEQRVMYGRLEVPVFDYTENDYRLYTPGDLLIRSLGREVGA